MVTKDTLRTILNVCSTVETNFDRASFSKDDETNMTLLGYLTLLDPPKAGIADTLKELKLLGIITKMITGDSRAVAICIIQQVGLPEPKALTGAELQKLSDEALTHQVGNRVGKICLLKWS